MLKLVRRKAEIIRVAAENEVDLIVVGSSGRWRGLALLLGSTANAVLHGALCDVLTVRFPSERGTYSNTKIR